jgi:hypothetical protein
LLDEPKRPMIRDLMWKRGKGDGDGEGGTVRWYKLAALGGTEGIEGWNRTYLAPLDNTAGRFLKKSGCKQGTCSYLSVMRTDGE